MLQITILVCQTATIVEVGNVAQKVIKSDESSHILIESWSSPLTFSDTPLASVASCFRYLDIYLFVYTCNALQLASLNNFSTDIDRNVPFFYTFHITHKCWRTRANKGSMKTKCNITTSLLQGKQICSRFINHTSTNTSLHILQKLPIFIYNPQQTTNLYLKDIIYILNNLLSYILPSLAKLSESRHEMR